jgi:hypothetical protein
MRHLRLLVTGTPRMVAMAQTSPGSGWPGPAAPPDRDSQGLAAGAVRRLYITEVPYLP